MQDDRESESSTSRARRGEEGGEGAKAAFRGDGEKPDTDTREPAGRPGRGARQRGARPRGLGSTAKERMAHGEGEAGGGTWRWRNENRERREKIKRETRRETEHPGGPPGHWARAAKSPAKCCPHPAWCDLLSLPPPSFSSDYTVTSPGKYCLARGLFKCGSFNL